MLNIAVCEDQRSELAHIRELLKSYSASHSSIELRVEQFDNAEKLLDALRAGAQYDVYLLDIILPGQDGIALSRTIRENGYRGEIIFLTSTRDYAFEAYGVRAVSYLLKPVEQESLFAALEQARTFLNGKEEDRYTIIKTAAADRIVNFKDIVFIEVQGHTLCYCLAGGEVLKSKVLRIPFAVAAADLVADAQFIRPHQSFLVNAGHVSSISQKKFVMDDGTEIPISRLRFSEVKAQYMDYLAKRSGAARDSYVRNH